MGQRRSVPSFPGLELFPSRRTVSYGSVRGLTVMHGGRARAEGGRSVGPSVRGPWRVAGLASGREGSDSHLQIGPPGPSTWGCSPDAGSGSWGRPRPNPKPFTSLAFH